MALANAETPERVRQALDISLDANVLPDSVILSPVYAADAEAELLLRDPNAATYALGTTQRTNADNALAYLIGARLAGALPAIISEQLGDYRYTLAQPDAAALAGRLRSLANNAIAANTTTDGLPEIPPMFCVAAGRRGR